MVRRQVRLTGGPGSISKFQGFSNLLKFEIQNSDLPNVQNSSNFARREFVTQL
jgi:hypothetical protein